MIVNNNNNNNKLTRLDHSVAVIIANPDQTGSRKAGITKDVERLHRFHGTSIILESSRGLKLEPSSYATACTIFHRFYHPMSLKQYDVWSVAMASTLLATKVEEDPKSLQQIIEEYARIYARRLILADLLPDDDADKKDDLITTTKVEELVRSSPHIAYLPIQISGKQRKYICEPRLPQHLNKFGPIFKEWHTQISKMESILLRQLGFTFYWISDSHPHKFILNFCQALELNDKMVCIYIYVQCITVTIWKIHRKDYTYTHADKYLLITHSQFSLFDIFYYNVLQVTQRAWNYCNDSYRLDLSVRYPPEVIVSAAINYVSNSIDYDNLRLLQNNDIIVFI
jgi:hypothetical protein